jgi:two-component system LytT family response regulator
MLVSTLEGIHFIPVDDIVRLEAQQNSTEIFYTGAKKRLIASMNIGAYEEQFEPYRSFMRVHRAHLVNLMRVETYVRGDAHLLMNDGSKVAVSRENRDELLKRLREI